MENFKVGELPSVYYIPDFVTAEQERKLIDQIHAAPRTKWRELKGRRLQYWGGMVHEKGMIPEPVPKWLEGVLTGIAAKTDMFPSPLNHVLINEYLPGQGIMPHQDGPMYYPVVAILSLGSPAVMRFTPRKSSSPHHPDDSQATTEPGTNLSSAVDSPSHSSSQEHTAANALASEASGLSGHSDSSAAAQASCQETGQTANVMQNGTADSGKSVFSKFEDQLGFTGARKPSHCSVVLMPRSLLIFKDEAYTDHLHGIDESMEHEIDETVVNLPALEIPGFLDVEQRSFLPSLGGESLPQTVPRLGPRLSLTCRHVLKVRKAMFRIR
ncbi:oxidoreductase [Klebsormidium nitens]|uniref:Oxidoreductase n=1 Tax=Klebsormidium nitens TaxID=105231 RepID=A0A1Y1IH77_KLENI|nr:oxidoreductase [Klebsormidium nitens]|eukprot:GAQ90220.1 oxidoreductase [Klebsormidium nitens]